MRDAERLVPSHSRPIRAIAFRWIHAVRHDAALHPQAPRLQCAYPLCIVVLTSPCGITHAT